MVSKEVELVLRAREGDRDAFTWLYNAYFGRIYDFSYQMVRSHDDAADVVSEVFVKAMERIGSLKDPAAFRGWLYAIARNASLSLIDRRKRTTALPDELEPVDAGAGPADLAERGELSALVWEAASTLSPRDYSVFDMTVRQGLDSAEVAEALGVKPSHAYVLVSRVKDSIEDALGAVVLARAGRRDCAVLDSIVSELGDERSPRMRKAVIRHLRRCDDCKTSRKRYASVAALLSGVAHASPVDAELKGRLAEQLANLWPTRARTSNGSGPSRLARGAAVPAVMAAFTVFAVIQGAAPHQISGRWPIRVAETAPPTPTATLTPSPTPEPSPGITPSPRPRITPAPRATPRVIILSPKPSLRPTLRPTLRSNPAPVRVTPRPPTPQPQTQPTPCRDPKQCPG